MSVLGYVHKEYFPSPTGYKRPARKAKDLISSGNYTIDMLKSDFVLVKEFEEFPHLSIKEQKKSFKKQYQLVVFVENNDTISFY